MPTSSDTKASTAAKPAPYQPSYKIRIVTAASLFDGHDASINIMRRILQASGAEVVHLGHNRSVQEIVRCAIQEDAQGIAISSYQGGHIEYFKYMVDLLKQEGASHIRVFGGGGGVIVDEEIRELHAHGVTRIFSVEDGRAMGLQGMIDHIMQQCDFDPLDVSAPSLGQLQEREPEVLARLITALENGRDDVISFQDGHLVDGLTAMPVPPRARKAPVFGITGTGGA